MTDGGARIEGAYRYSLWRRVGRSPRRVLFVMLNPSTADANDDDPTIRRCIGFARAWGYGELEVCNLFAYRTPHPRVLLAARDPVGPENDAWLARAAGRASRVVAAWGVVGMRSARAEVVMEILRGARVVCLGQTRGGAPRHPLYVAGGTRARAFAWHTQIVSDQSIVSDAGEATALVQTTCPDGEDVVPLAEPPTSDREASCPWGQEDRLRRGGHRAP
ncbi:MAG TPA: DUF1643 domain-containing protein [Polyangiaceae bacterium]|jgi:hypothetical protein|nr:DUF1643 domain-containing protein [Polyangiaceae bacterium]